jgi:hypothetical protein
MSNGFILAEKYLEDSYAWNTGKAKEIEEKYIKESYKDRHPYDLTPLTPKEADEKLLMFVKKYPNEWHGFQKDKLTKDSIKKLEKMGALKVDWDNRTFYYETKEQKDEVKTPSPRVTVKVSYDNGDYTVTTINTDYEGAKKYFMGKVFTDEDEMTGKETNKKVVKVDLVKGPEQKDETDSLFSRKDFFKFYDKHPEFKGKISIEGPREDSKGRVEFVITTPKGGKRIVVTSEKTKEELEKIGQKLLR